MRLVKGKRTYGSINDYSCDLRRRSFTLAHSSIAPARWNHSKDSRSRRHWELGSLAPQSLWSVGVPDESAFVISEFEIQALLELEEKMPLKPWYIGHVSEIQKDAADIDSSDGAICDNVYGGDLRSFIIESRNLIKPLCEEWLQMKEEIKSTNALFIKERRDNLRYRKALKKASSNKQHIKNKDKWNLSVEALAIIEAFQKEAREALGGEDSE